MVFMGIISLSEFCRKYKMNEKQKTELITMQAFHQGVAGLLGAGIVIASQWIIGLVTH